MNKYLILTTIVLLSISPIYAFDMFCDYHCTFGNASGTLELNQNYFTLLEVQPNYPNYLMTLKNPNILTVNCDTSKNGLNLSDDYYLFELPYVSQCAIVNANPSIYNESFKEYHVCFQFENKSIGDCE